MAGRMLADGGSTPVARKTVTKPKPKTNPYASSSPKYSTKAGNTGSSAASRAAQQAAAQRAAAQTAAANAAKAAAIKKTATQAAAAQAAAKKPAPSVPRTTNDAQYLSAAQKAQIAANAAKYNPKPAAKPVAKIAAPVAKVVAPVAKVAAPVKAVAPVAKVAAPVAAPPTVAATGTGTNTSFTRSGGGTAGRFARERQNRGPRSGTSITPEMLMRIARQRFSQQR